MLYADLITAAATPAEVSEQRAWASYNNLPLSFIANGGQTDPEVHYYAKRLGCSFFFSRGKAVFAFLDNNLPVYKPTNVRNGLSDRIPVSTGQPMRGVALSLRFVGANPAVRLEGAAEAPGKVNYFIGNDPIKWRTNLSTYGEAFTRDYGRGWTWYSVVCLVS